MKNLTMLKLVILTIIATLTNFSLLEAAIPEYVGLYSIFRQNNDSSEIDPISMGQAILYNSYNSSHPKILGHQHVDFKENNYSWIEDIYTFGHDGNKAKRVIEILWFKRIKDRQGNFNINAHFQLSQNFPIKAMKPQDLGKIINYVRTFNKPDGSEKNSKEIEASRKTFIRRLRKRFRSGQSEAILNNLLLALEELKFDPNFYPETAEAILWALFEAKFDGQEEFKECLDQISPELKNNLNKLYDFKIVSEKYKGKEANKIADLIKAQANGEKIELERDEILYYFIKTIKPQFIPNVEWTTLSHTDPKTNMEFTNTSCFESSMLEFISLLIYDQEKKEFNPYVVLPENITNQTQFKANLREIFYADKNDNTDENAKASLIDLKKINIQIQAFADTVTNLPELKYTKWSLENPDFKFDLAADFTNLIKILNTFFSLKLKITDTQDTFIVADDTGYEVKIKQDKKAHFKIAQGDTNEILCKNLLDKIAQKLSTEKKAVNFSKIEIKEDEEGVKYIILAGLVGRAEFEISLSGGHGSFDIKNRTINDFTNLKERLIYPMPKDPQKYEAFFKAFAPLALIIENKELTNLSNFKISNMINKVGNFKYMFLDDRFNFSRNNKSTLKDVKLFIISIKNNLNLKHLISNFILNYQLNENLFKNLIILHNEFKEENFITEAIYLYTQKTLTNKTERHEVINNFYEILSFADSLTSEIDEKLNKNNSMQKIVIENMKKHLEQLDSCILNFYIKNLTSNSKNQKIYENEMKEIILSTVRHYQDKTEYHMLEFYCRHLAETTNNKFMDDFLKDTFKKIINTNQINLKRVLRNISSGQNEEALDMLPLEKLIENNNTPIINANNINILKKLLALKNVLVNSRERNFLEKIFKLKKDEDSNNQDSPLVESLVMYRYNNNIEKIKLLLSHKKINVNDQDKEGDTPIIKAISSLSIHPNNKKGVNELLSNDKIDINKCNLYKETPLHKLISEYSSFLHILVNEEIKTIKTINSRANNVNTNFIDTIKKILLFNNLDLEAKNHWNQTPIELARELRERFTSDHNEDVNTEKIKMEMFDEVISLLEYKKNSEDNWLFLKP